MRCAVIGDPAEHSLSPAIHQAGYLAVGLQWRYEAITVAASELQSFITSCQEAGDWAGLSVTAPHKERLLEFGQPDHVARMVGGGNTIVFGEQPQVYNTDVPGFVRAWRHRGLGQLKSAVIVGAGATARSLLVALAGLAVQQITVFARTPAKAEPLRILGTALGINMTLQPLDASFPDVDLVASTIPASAAAPYAAAWATRAEILFDAIYHPWPTALAQAADPSQPVITGLELLAGQAVDQFQLLTGSRLSFDRAISAAQTELRRRQQL